jgi:hypothetical protein
MASANGNKAATNLNSWPVLISWEDRKSRSGENCLGWGVKQLHPSDLALAISDNPRHRKVFERSFGEVVNEKVVKELQFVIRLSAALENRSLKRLRYAIDEFARNSNMPGSTGQEVNAGMDDRVARNLHNKKALAEGRKMVRRAREVQLATEPHGANVGKIIARELKGFRGMRELSQRLSIRIAKAAPSVWYSDSAKRLSFGLACPDVQTALFVLAMGRIELGSIGSCERCHNPLLAQRGNKRFCSHNCRSAFHMSNKRESEKEKSQRVKASRKRKVST